MCMYFCFFLSIMLIKHIVNQWKGFLTAVCLTSTYSLPYPCAWRHMLPHTPISQPVSHEEADETELEQRRGQGWKCEAGMSNWKGDNHKNMHISCYVTDPATWTYPYLWDPSLTKQMLMVCAWISVWGAWNSDFVIVVMAVTTCGPPEWFGLNFLMVLLCEDKDTDRIFFVFALLDLALLWPECDPWKQLHEQISLISFSLERDSLCQLLNLQMQKGMAEASVVALAGLYNFAQLYFK